MKTHLISGGCGFVGRNLVKRLLKTSEDRVVIVDDLSTGQHPDKWLPLPLSQERSDLAIYGSGNEVIFIQADFRAFLQRIDEYSHLIAKQYGIEGLIFHDVYHLAAIVGGRALIEADPIKVALDLAIDAEFFYWVSRYRPQRVLYPSSSAAYPISLQQSINAKGLREADIDFSEMKLPDMTYGWSKLTGEYLAQLTAKHYGISIACVRPFSGYGEDQDIDYPIPAIVQRVIRREDPLTVWGDGTQSRDFVHIEDVLDCMALAIDLISDGSAINIGTGNSTNFIEIIQHLCRLADYAPAIKTLPDKPVGVYARYADMTTTTKRLGWKAKISLEEGLKRVYLSQTQKLAVST